MYWEEVLDNAQGVMILEGIENFRQAMPMTDNAGATKFKQQQKKQMMSIWGVMFPRSAEFDKETIKRRDTFKKQRGAYKRIKDDLNRERGT